MNKWTFTDPVTSEVYTFQMNPNTFSFTETSRNITEEPTVHPSGTTVLYEGRAKPRPLSFEGVFHEKAQNDALIAWFRFRRRVLLTDDNLWQYWIYITDLSITREKGAINRPWRHNFSVRGIYTAV